MLQLHLLMLLLLFHHDSSVCIPGVPLPPLPNPLPPFCESLADSIELYFSFISKLSSWINFYNLNNFLQIIY